MRLCGLFQSQYFNQRIREECDSCLCACACCQNAHFNQRTREECDFHISVLLTRISLFQSTHPWRVRRVYVQKKLWAEKFQSTHRWRVRLDTVGIESFLKLFQSTYPWRVWHWRWWASWWCGYDFNQRHLWRVRLWGKGDIMAHFHISINVPVKSATEFICVWIVR